MKNEIESAANFLSNMLKLHSSILTPCQLEQFKRAISLCLESHYQSHWFPDRPTKGSGYRCIRINHKMDPIISQAGQSCGIDSKSLKSIFPNELTLWIDPQEVAYRIGENGSICVLFDGQQNAGSTSGTSESIDKDQSTPVPHQLQQHHVAVAKHQQHHHRSPYSKYQQHPGHSGHSQHRNSGRGSPSDSQSNSSSTSTMSSPSPSSSPDWVRNSYGNSPTDNWKAAERRSSPESVMTGPGGYPATTGLDAVAMFAAYPHPGQVGATTGHPHFAFAPGVVNQVSGHRSGHQPVHHPAVPGQTHFGYPQTAWVGSPFRA